LQLSRGSGNVIRRFNPLGNTIEPDTFVSSPISADSEGNIYYNVLKLNITNDPATNDPRSFGPNSDGNGAADIPDSWPGEDFRGRTYHEGQLQEPDLHSRGAGHPLRDLQLECIAVAAQPDGGSSNRALPVAATA
jgi:hypothetical protein